MNKTDWKGYGFKIEEVEEIKPIEINGKLSLWEYDYNAKGEWKALKDKEQENINRIWKKE